MYVYFEWFWGFGGHPQLHITYSYIDHIRTNHMFSVMFEEGSH